MKICSKCGFQHADDAAFCGNCGSTLADAQHAPSSGPMYPAYPGRRRNQWKILLITAAIILGFWGLGEFFSRSNARHEAELQALPEQHAFVEVISKSEHGSGKYQYRMQVRFEDGTVKGFPVDEALYESIEAGDTGTIYYKEHADAKRYTHRRLVKFETELPDSQTAPGTNAFPAFFLIEEWNQVKS